MSESRPPLDQAVQPIHDAAERFAMAIKDCAADPYLQDAAIRVGISSALWKMHDVYRHQFNEDWMLQTMTNELEKQLAVLKLQIDETNNA